jgi:hypothetical protein
MKHWAAGPALDGASASTVASVDASAFSYHRDAASFHRTPHHDPGDESSF